MTTETDICNLALDLLKEGPITSLEEDRPIARWFKRNFAIARDGILKRANWNHATRRAVLSAESNPPAFGWTYGFVLPPECIRVIPLTHDGSDEGVEIPHAVEDGRVLTDACGPLPVRYIYRSTNYDAYSPECIELIAARLAAKCGHFLTGKTSYIQIAKATYDEAWRDAWALDSMEGTVPRSADDEWINSR
jgi:hypothetical protein